MQDVPCPDTVDVVMDGAPRVRSRQAGHERRDDLLAGGGSQVLWNAPCVAVHVVS